MVTFVLPNSLLARFMPQENRFYVLLGGIARNVCVGADAFGRLRDATTPEEFLRISEQLRDIEHVNDQMANEFYTALDQTFVTPIDREDLHDLCSALDTITDLMEECTGLIVNYRLPELTPPMRELIRVAKAASYEVETIIKLVKESSGKFAELQVHLARLHALENEGDTVFRLALGDLFLTQTDAIELIRQKDIIEALEGTVDATDEVGKLVRSLAMKHA